MNRHWSIKSGWFAGLCERQRKSWKGYCQCIVMDTRGAYNRGANASESSVSAASGTGGAEDSGKKSALVLSLAGARTLQQIIQAPPSVCAPVLSSFMEQTQEQLVLCHTSCGKQSSHRAILTGPNDFNRAKQGIVDGLAGRLVDVAGSFWNICCSKCYAIARLQQKELWHRSCPRKRECFLEMHMAGMFCALPGRALRAEP